MKPKNKIVFIVCLNIHFCKILKDGCIWYNVFEAFSDYTWSDVMNVRFSTNILISYPSKSIKALYDKSTSQANALFGFWLLT